MNTIPLKAGVPLQRLTTVLDGRTYELTVRWNMTSGVWFLDLRDVSGDLLLGSKAMVVGSDLLGRSRHDVRIPQGGLFVVPLGNTASDPTLNAWDDTHVLLFVATGEL